MDCTKIEQSLSEYLESSLPADEMSQVARHLESCRNCTALLDEMRSALAACQNYPVLEMEPDLLERVLLRTSGRPRTRSFRERFNKYFLLPLLTPRFAAGAVLATLFLALMINFMGPRISTAMSNMTPSKMFEWMDRNAQKLYGQGLKAYDKVDSWQAKFNEIRNNTPNKLRYMIEKIEAPVEGRKKPEENNQEKGKSPKEKSSRLLSWPA